MVIALLSLAISRRKTMDATITLLVLFWKYAYHLSSHGTYRRFIWHTCRRALYDDAPCKGHACGGMDVLLRIIELMD
jgi:hypothetical protein